MNPLRRGWCAFLDGMSGAGLFRPVVRRKPRPADSDLTALRSDWQRIGEDFHAAIRETGTSQKDSQAPGME